MTGMALCIVIICGSLFLTYQIKTNFREEYEFEPNSKGFEMCIPYIIVSLLVISILTFYYTDSRQGSVISTAFSVIASIMLFVLRATIHMDHSVIDHNYDTKSGPGAYAAGGFTILFLFYNLSGNISRKK